MVSQPKAPDPYATANAQNQQNAYASQYNSASGNVNEVNPYGSVSYRMMEQVPIYTNGQISGYAPRYERTTTLSPDQQQLFGLETQSKYNLGRTAVEQSSKLRDHLGRTIDSSQWQSWGAAPSAQPIRRDEGPTDRVAIEKAMMDSYDRATKGRNEAEDAQMAARGLSPGGKGYGTMMQGRQDARGEATRQAYVGSGNEARAAQGAYNDASTQQFNMDQQIANYYNNLRGAQMQETIALRNQPINETTALMSGAQATVPQFQPFQSSPVQSSNIAKYINDNYAARSQAAAATNAGIFGLVGNLARMPFSGFGGAAAA